MKKLTPAQKRWLVRLAKGVQTRPYGDNFRSFDRLMSRLVSMGLAREYPHGGFEITEIGRAHVGAAEGFDVEK